MDKQDIYQHTANLESALQDAISALQGILESLQEWNVELERLIAHEEDQ